jgi:hypothetical protein
MAKKDGMMIDSLGSMAASMGVNGEVHVNGASGELRTDEADHGEYQAADADGDDDALFDPANLRSEQHYEKFAARKVITTIPVTKPRPIGLSESIGLYSWKASR